MKRTARNLDEMHGTIPEPIKSEVELSFQISDRIDELVTVK